MPYLPPHCWFRPARGRLGPASILGAAGRLATQNPSQYIDSRQSAVWSRGSSVHSRRGPQSNGPSSRHLRVVSGSTHWPGQVPLSVWKQSTARSSTQIWPRGQRAVFVHAMGAVFNAPSACEPSEPSTVGSVLAHAAPMIKKARLTVRAIRMPRRLHASRRSRSWTNARRTRAAPRSRASRAM